MAYRESREEAGKGCWERESLRASEWRERAKETAVRAAQVVKREATVRWLGRVLWRSIARKWRRERRVLECAEINAVHEATLGGKGSL